jgi:hypothetical protein
MNSSNKSDEQPIATHGGTGLSQPPPADPFKALDDLMAAVEALCPTWPPRETFINTGHMLL